MNHFRPHIPIPTFEGYYSKFMLPSSSTLILIICSVPRADTKPHMMSLTYIPHDFPNVPHFQREVFTEEIQMIDRPTKINEHLESSKGKVEFEIRIPNMGTMRVYETNAVDFDITHTEGDFQFTASIASGEHHRTPWSKSDPSSTPEGLLVHLPLPLHWHVHSIASKCDRLKLTVRKDIYPHIHSMDTTYNHQDTTATNIPRTLSLGACYAHLEKNWAHSFPTSHIWIQAYNPSTRSALSVAGGSIIKTQAYLVTYHHSPSPSHDEEEDYSITFAPPYAMAPTFLPSLSPTLSATTSWTSRSIHLAISSPTRKIVIDASAPRGSFVGLTAPFFDGHRDNYVGQSMQGTVEVRVLHATWAGLGHWEEKIVERFEHAGIEFGGDAYGMAGKEDRVS